MPEEKKFKTIDEKLASLTPEQAKHLFNHLIAIYPIHQRSGPRRKSASVSRNRNKKSPGG